MLAILLANNSQPNLIIKFYRVLKIAYITFNIKVCTLFAYKKTVKLMITSLSCIVKPKFYIITLFTESNVASASAAVTSIETSISDAVINRISA